MKRPAKWIQAIHRNDWRPSSSSLLCSEHFIDRDFDKTTNSERRRLKDDAVPSRFEAFPPHLKKNTSSRKSPKKRERSPSPQPEPSNAGTLSPTKIVKHATLDHSYDCPPRKKGKLNNSKEVKRKIKTLHIYILRLMM